MQSALYDAAGHRRSPVTMPGFHEGRAPRNIGRRYPADPPTVEEIIAVMRAAGTSADGARLRALIVILWRAGLRIGEALDLAETDLDASRGAVLGAPRQGRPASRGRDGSLGLVSVRAMDVGSAPVAGRRAVVCDPWRDRRSPLGVIFSSQATGAHRSQGGRAAAVRSPEHATRFDGKRSPVNTGALLPMTGSGYFTENASCTGGRPLELLMESRMRRNSQVRFGGQRQGDHRPTRPAPAHRR
jgi:hypothetical protein